MLGSDRSSLPPWIGLQDVVQNGEPRDPVTAARSAQRRSPCSPYDPRNQTTGGLAGEVSLMLTCLPGGRCKRLVGRSSRTDNVERSLLHVGAIRHAVWLDPRFTLGFRDGQDRPAARGANVSRETIRCWTIKVGPQCVPCRGALHRYPARAPRRSCLQLRRRAESWVAGGRRQCEIERRLARAMHRLLRGAGSSRIKG